MILVDNMHDEHESGIEELNWVKLEEIISSVLGTMTFVKEVVSVVVAVSNSM